MSDLNTQLVFGANTAGAEAGVRTVKRSLKDLSDTAASAGKSIEGVGDRAGKSLAGMGDGAEVAARKIQRDTSAMRGSLQRYLASLEAGSKDSRRYWETMADFKGIDRNALSPLLNQLDAYNAKTKEAAESTVSWTGGLSRIGAGVAGVAAITATVGVAAKAMFDASVSAERLRTMLDFSTGGNSAKEIEYLRGITYRLGLEFTSTAKAYSQFSAAAKGTALEGDKARAVFESVAKASSVMGLSAADTSGVLLALQQMISKGTVQAEELRGQLGERLPGAFQIAAKAMGVTTGELGKMLEQGQVIADDFLPKFAAALDKNLGGAAEKAANRLDASVNRLSTAWDRLKQNSGDSGVSSFMAGQYEILADGFNGVSEAMERARGSGSGFVGQMAAGAVAAAKFANPLQAVSYSAIETGNALKQAEAEMAALQARGAATTTNIYLKDSYYQLQEYIKELKKAQSEQAKLTGGPAVNPNMNAGVIASGQAREQFMKQRAADLEAANAFRLNQAGVPASYLKDMAELIRLNQAGVIVGKEYTDALKAQQDLLLKKTTTVRGSAAAANAEQNAYESLIASIRAKIEAENLEIAGGAALTESQRIRIKLDQDLAAGRMKLTAQNERAVRLALEELAASEAAAEAQKALAKAQADATADRMKVVQSMEASAASVQTQNDALREEIELIGLSAAQQTLVLQQRNEVIILTKEATLAELERQSAVTGTQTRVEIALASEIEALKERNALLGAKGVKNAAVDVAKTAADEWQKTTDSINQTLTDSLMRGFESGKDMARNLRDTVVSMFKTMVLRPVISAIINPISGALTGMMGLSGAAQAATGGAGALSTVGSIGSGVSMLSGLGAFGGGLAGGFGGLMGSLGMSATGATLGGAMSAGSIAMGAGNIAGGLGTLAGALGPIALGIGLLSSLIKKSTPHMGAASSYSAATGLVSGVDVYRASGLADTRTYSADAEKVTATVAQSIAQALDSTAVAFGKKAGYEISTAFADDKSKDGAWGSLIIKQMGEAVLNWQDTQTSKWAPKEFADGEAGAKEYQQALAKSVREVIEGMGLPEWAARITRALPDSATMDDLTAALAQVKAYPAQLLQQFGTSRDAMVQQFAQGLASGNAASAGQAVADTLVASIQNAVFTNAAGQIFDTVNMGIVTPMLDAIATGASVADALSQATIDATIERAKAQAQALAELFGNAEFAAAMEQLRTAVGGALGQAGGYLQALPQTLVATQQIDTAAQDARTAADEAARKWQDVTDALLGDQAQLGIELLRAQGREEEALARERALAIEGMDAYQTALYDSNRALRSQIDTLRELGELLPSVIDQYLTPEQRTSNAYSGIASDLVGAGLSGMDAGALAQALAGATKGEIAEAATAIYQMTGVTDEMRVALLRAAGSLATLKDEAASAASGGLDAAYSALERAVQARRSVVQDTVNDVRAVFDTVRSAARDLFGEVDSVVQFNAQAGRAYITQALGAAQSTGYLPDGEQLSEAIRAARAGLQGQVFASQAEADYQKLVLANELKALQDISGDQLTEAEQQLKALDGILETTREQIDELRGIKGEVMTVEAALSNIASIMLAAQPGKTSAGVAAGNAGAAGAMPDWATFGVGDWMTSSTGSLVFDNSTGMLYGQGDVTSHRSQLRDAAAALLEAGQSQQLYDAVRGSGFTLDQADAILGLPAGEAEKWARSLGLPVFHDGTPYVPRTGFALLEQGEAVFPRAFNPFTGGGAGGNNNARLEALVEAMASELAQMRTQLDEANRHAARTADATNGRPEAPVLVEVVD